MSPINVLVIFSCRSGSTEKLALAAAVGAVQARANIRLRLLPDTAGEFLHFTLPASPSSLGTIFYSDLFEDVVGGTLSDRLLVIYAANSSTVDVRFASDPASIILPPGASNFVNRVEDGTFQFLGPFQIYIFEVKSDRSDVPAPATLFLLGSGLAALGGAAWRRCRRA